MLRCVAHRHNCTQNAWHRHRLHDTSDGESVSPIYAWQSASGGQGHLSEEVVGRKHETTWLGTSNLIFGCANLIVTKTTGKHCRLLASLGFIGLRQLSAPLLGQSRRRRRLEKLPLPECALRMSGLSGELQRGWVHEIPAASSFYLER